MATPRDRSPFLTAEWRDLAMLNYEIDPAVLRPLVPQGTELDTWQGLTYVSVVGFRFLDTRVLGIAIPFHRNFEEVNLRFYVRRRAPDGWRRGVVFVKEIVPRVAIALVARLLYGENYVALPTRHAVTRDSATRGRTVTYAWRLHGREHSIEISVASDPGDVATGSNAEFISEHYWGYTRRAGERTIEYRVAHPQWRVAPAEAARLDSDVTALYGAQFAEALSGAPASAFLADGSRVTVYKGATLLP